MVKTSLPLLGLALLGVVVSCVFDEERTVGTAYDRGAFGDWADTDGDCRNTRHEILADLSTAAVRTTRDGCRVERGRWFDPYTGETETDAAELDIDHVVPLAWAWAHGADGWNDARRAGFANDPRNLLPVAAGVNRSKGAAGPDEWLPPFEAGQCAYLLRFLRVVRAYELTLDDDEARRFERTRSRVYS